MYTTNISQYIFRRSCQCQIQIEMSMSNALYLSTCHAFEITISHAVQFISLYSY